MEVGDEGAQWYPPPHGWDMGYGSNEASVQAEDEGEEALARVNAGLERLRLSQSAAKTGDEGRLFGRGAEARGGELSRQTYGQVCQSCQYGALACAGCHVLFGLCLLYTSPSPRD